MTALRILISGSREWRNRDAIQREIIAAAAAVDAQPQEVTIAHGNARGADTIAKELGERFGCTVEAHPVTPADWDRYGKSAGHRRNAGMVALGADVCLAFPIGESRGTRDCIRQAQAAGIPVRIFEGTP